MIIIPIGLQCTNATFKRKIGKTSETFPFDWMFAPPKFVFEMLDLLLNKNMNVEELVTKHFFVCDKKATDPVFHHFKSSPEGRFLYNSKYGVIFPHDELSQETVQKYIRRFERLKKLILTTSKELIFMYSSQSSLKRGNYTIDGKEMISDVYSYMTKIYELIGKYHGNYKMFVFDAIQNENKKLLHNDIVLIKLNRCIFWTDFFPQIEKQRGYLTVFYD
jgi:hypothetical protein